MESQLDSSLDWSGSPGPLSAPPLVEEYPDGQPPREEIVASEPSDQHKSTDDTFPNDFKVNYFRTVNSYIRHERIDEPLKLINIDGKRHKPVNLMNDPVLNVVISANKTQLAVKLIEQVKSVESLREQNIYGDTALHIAAAEGNISVAEALLRRESQLVKAVNKKGETAMHKAAMYSHRHMFWCLVKLGGTESAMHRKGDGSNMLHCAIMGNDPKLALDIARNFPELKFSRDAAAMTPLQLMVTISKFFHSQLVVDRLESFLYRLIPLEEDSQGKNAIADEEAGRFIHTDANEESYGWTWKSVRSKCPAEYTTILDLIELIASWSRQGVFNILKRFSQTVRDLETQKIRYVTAMALAEYLVNEEEYDFYCKGYLNKHPPTAFDAMRSHSDPQQIMNVDDQLTPEKPTPDNIAAEIGLHDYVSEVKKIMKVPQEETTFNRWTEPPLIIAAEIRLHDYVSEEVKKIMKVPQEKTTFNRWTEPPLIIAAEIGLHDYVSEEVKKIMKVPQEKTTFNRWTEPPLIIAAELGLHDFVRKTLQVCPQSAIYLDTRGRNVMQVAIQSGHEKVVSVISEMLQGSNPILPSCLLSMLDNASERNTILHLAAKNCHAEGDALQLHDELVWFEMLENIVPKELVNSRNGEQKTAHELFTETHKGTLKSCQKQLVEMGTMCSGLVAAAVFTSSISFPDEKKTELVKFALTIFSHAYVIGFGCAATAMVLFMSFVIVPCKERYFRRAIPMQFLFACLSFALALAAFLISFACNFVVQIYGGDKMKATHSALICSILELLFFPIVCITALLYFGAKLVPSFSRYWK